MKTEKRVSNLCRLVSILGLTAVSFSTSLGQGRDIKDFVRNPPIASMHHGVNYGETTKLDSSVVPTLLEMLNDPKEEQWWDNVIEVLGIIGDERAVKPIIERLERQGTEPGRWACPGCSNAIVNIAGKGSEKALTYLLATIEPETYRVKGTTFPHRNASGHKIEREDVLVGAIRAVGDSAQPRAVEALQKIYADNTQSERIREAVRVAIKRAKKIQEVGRAEFYDSGLSAFYPILEEKRAKQRRESVFWWTTIALNIIAVGGFLIFLWLRHKTASAKP